MHIIMKTNKTYLQPQTTLFVLTTERLMDSFGISVGGDDTPIEGIGTGYGGGTH